MANKPVLEFKSNIPVTVKVNKMFKKKEAPDDHPEWGETYCYDVSHEGVDKVYFAKDRWHELVSEYPQGSTLVITFAEKKNDSGRTYHEWEVKQAFLDKDGNPIKPVVPEPNLKKDSEARSGFREERNRLFKENLMDALAIATAYNEYVMSNAPDGAYLLDHEDIRSIAISFKIELDRK